MAERVGRDDRHEERGYPILALWVTALMLAGVLVAAIGLVEGAPREGGVRPGDVTEGALLWRTAGQEALVPAPTLDTDVEIRVTGIVARARVRQAFANPSGEWAEGVYVFPLPEDAAVDRLRMQVGDRMIDGVIRERAAAKAAYEEARREGRRASLVEQERANVFTASVANIAPGATITVEIEYQQVVPFADGEYRLRFPMVVGPRYVPGTTAAPGVAPAGTGWAPDTDQVPDASRITPPVRHPRRGPINPVRLAVDLVAAGPLAALASSHHAVRVHERPDGSRRVALAPGTVPADRDFELVWRPAPGPAPAAAAFAETREGETFVLLTVLPPAPAALAERRTPREAIFVIDTSGSMHGASIEQARAALALALGRLAPGDTFNVVQFNSRTGSVFAAPVPATPANLETAARFVGSLRAQGGTEMRPALERALDGQPAGGRLRQVIFLTDGAVGNEEALFALIRERLGAARLFTVGIGSAPNSHFMREAARHGRGTFTYVGSPAEVQARMDALLRKLELPALTDLRLELPGAAVDAQPARIPDLYAGEPVTVALRGAALPARAILRGRRGAEEWRQEVALAEARPGSGIAAHWARARIAALLDARRAGGAEDDVRAAVVDLALRHHLVSVYTSLVAVDVTPARPAGEPLRRHALETNLPAGWSHEAVFGLGQGATPAGLEIALGLAALALAGAVHAAARRRAAVVRAAGG